MGALWESSRPTTYIYIYMGSQPFPLHVYISLIPQTMLAFRGSYLSSNRFLAPALVPNSGPRIRSGLPRACRQLMPPSARSLPDASRCLQMPPDASRRLPDASQMPPDASQMHPDASRCFQMPPDASQMPPRCLQMPPDAFHMPSRCRPDASR